LENLKKRDHLKDLGVDERIITMDFREIGWEGVDGIICLRIGTSVGLL
jgi:hypothetical protein